MREALPYFLLPVLFAASLAAQRPTLDQRAPAAGEWGERPVDGARADVNPPAFVWRPQVDAVRYEWQAARSATFTIGVRLATVQYPVYCPDAHLAAGTWFWRFRFHTEKLTSDWSRTRTVEIPDGAAAFAMPGREAIESRLPKKHPRLFVRPDDVPGLQELAKGELAKPFAALVARCDGWLADEPKTEEPPKYREGTKRKSEEWRRVWWGNRTRTIQVLSAAAELAFVAKLGGEKKYAELARKLLMAAAKWDPSGATSFAYNDEAGMPYAYWFARAYTFLFDELTEDERKTCRAVIRARGKEMYSALAPQHFFRPYNSHNNRAWHFLGELGVAFYEEIPEAADWVWFASRVFGAVYPVWGDSDGGWHEGLAYWRSYLGRFTWWADVQKAAYGVDAYQKPFFRNVGDLVLYMQPPGTRGGGFGDLTGRLQSDRFAPLMHRFARAANNPHWEWHAKQSAPRTEAGFVGFLRLTKARVEAKPPTDLPTSKLFAGTGLAVLNHTLLAAKDNVQVVFKSSSFGSQSHGYEAQNSFLLYAFGERLLIRSGRRDIYGSAHHSKWMWSTRSTNNITVDGRGQQRHSAAATGAITEFSTSAAFDYVVGEAGGAYPDLKRFTRRILFVKPDYIVIHDTLQSDKPRKYQWWLHSLEKMVFDKSKSDGAEARVQSGKAACIVKWLVPEGIELTQTDAFDPPPRSRVPLTQHHATAATGKPATEQTFVTVIRPYRTDREAPGDFTAKVELVDGCYRLRLGDDVVVELRGDRTTATRGDQRFDSKPR